MQHIYPVCTDLGRVVYFKIIDHQLYIKMASDVDPKLASSVLVREFPAGMSHFKIELEVVCEFVTEN